jgi:hypothetical protein
VLGDQVAPGVQDEHPPVGVEPPQLGREVAAVHPGPDDHDRRGRAGVAGRLVPGAAQEAAEGVGGERRLLDLHLLGSRDQLGQRHRWHPFASLALFGRL